MCKYLALSRLEGDASERKEVTFLNLPQLTAHLGAIANLGQDPLLSRIKPVRTKLRANEKAYAVFLTFDLDSKEIRIEDPIPYHEELPKKYNYFGNNTAAALQCYLVREVESLHYLLTSVWNDLWLGLRQNGLEHSELARLLSRMEQASFITVGNKKGQGKLHLDKLALPSSLSAKTLHLNVEVKKIIVGEEIFKYESFVRAFLTHDNRNDRFILMIPAILEGGTRVVLSQHPDYLILVKKINKLESDNNDNGKTTNMDEQRVCHICQQSKTGVSSSYTTNFNRSGINKIFTTTTINSARYSDRLDNYDDAYSICNECYQQLLAGEAIIEQRFKGQIARESAFFLPEGLFESFDYESIGRIKDQMDFAFNSRDAKEWLKSVEADATWMSHPFFVIHIVIYRTDGNSITILETIEDVPALRILHIMQIMDQAADQIRPHLQGISIGSIYRMIPVRETKKGQVDIGRVLSLYKALILGHQIRTETLFDYACDAMDKGMRQLSKDRPDNYRNMDLLYYYPDKSDFFLQKICMQYLALFQTVQSLGLLDKPVFTHIGGRKEDSVMENISSFEALETFLGLQGFCPEAKALFYLGGLLHRVATEQYKKGHKTKPVLKKMQFQGMSAKEVFGLYEDVLDKLRQYDLFDLYSEQMMAAFHRHCGKMEKNWPLSDHANVFYIMSGYAYQTSVLVNRKKEGGNTDTENENEGEPVLVDSKSDS
jgi:CRISPR-associated protein Csh1